jgi:hypothetical protein
LAFLFFFFFFFGEEAADGGPEDGEGAGLFVPFFFASTQGIVELKGEGKGEQGLDQSLKEGGAGDFVAKEVDQSHGEEEEEKDLPAKEGKEQAPEEERDKESEEESQQDQLELVHD